MTTYPVMVKDVKAGMIISTEYGLPVMVDQVRQPSIDSDYVDIYYHIKGFVEDKGYARVHRLAVYAVVAR